MTDDGTITLDGDQALFHYVRRTAHPVEQTWQILTTPSEIAQWMGVEVEEFDPRPDGKIVMVHMGTQRVEDRVIKADPPNLLQHTYFQEMNPTAVVTWKVDAGNGGSMITLTHVMSMTEIDTIASKQKVEPALMLARNGAGWHHLLDMIELRLRGQEIPEWTPEDRQALQKHYMKLVP